MPDNSTDGRSENLAPRETVSPIGLDVPAQREFLRDEFGSALQHPSPPLRVESLDDVVHVQGHHDPLIVSPSRCKALRTESLPADAGYGLESFRHHFQGFGVVVHEDEVTSQFVGGHAGRAAAREEIQHDIAGVR